MNTIIYWSIVSSQDVSTANKTKEKCFKMGALSKQENLMLIYVVLIVQSSGYRFYKTTS
jgi:hypothetical protein